MSETWLTLQRRSAHEPKPTGRVLLRWCLVPPALEATQRRGRGPTAGSARVGGAARGKRRAGEGGAPQAGGRRTLHEAAGNGSDEDEEQDGSGQPGVCVCVFVL